MKQIFTLLSLFSTALVSAQTVVEGRLTDAQSSRSIAYASIVLKPGGTGTLTNGNGEFQLSVPKTAAPQWIHFSAMGYRTDSVLVKPSKTSYFVSLQPLEASALTDVVVSGTLREVSKMQSPVPVEVYSAQFFRANPTPSIFEALQQINGVRPQMNCNVCNTGDIRINGLPGPYTMVLIDGMPIVSGLSTVYGLMGIPQSLIERVEVVKGPASTLYGSEAVGGLINIITKKPGSAPVFSADVFGTQWGELNADVASKFSVGNKAQSLLGINHYRYTNPIDNNGDGFTDISLQNRISIFNKWNFERPQNRVFSLAGRYVYEDRWGGQMNWRKPFRGGDSIYGESIYTHRWELLGQYELPFARKLMLQTSANGHYQNSVYGQMPYMATQYTGFAQLTYPVQWSKANSLLLGASYRYTWLDDNTPATARFTDTALQKNAPAIIRLPGVFVQNELTMGEHNTLLVGLRYDHHSVHGPVFTPRMNYKWSSQNHRTALRVGAGSGYRVANVFTEDHAALTGARQLVFAEALRPERSWNANVNLMHSTRPWEGWAINFDVTAFYTHFQNRIIPDYSTDPNKIIYRNLQGYAVSQGLSANADIQMPKGFKATLGATVMDVRIKEEGQWTRPLLTEQFSGVWALRYRWQKAGIDIDYTGNVYGRMLMPLLSPLDERRPESPVFSLQNIQATKSVGQRWQVYAGIKNLLNFLPPVNSIARPFDPFDRGVVFGNDGQVVPGPGNLQGLSFDPTYAFAPNQGRRWFLGLRYTVK